jgi:hypothetical protein
MAYRIGSAPLQLNASGLSDLRDRMTNNHGRQSAENGQLSPKGTDFPAKTRKFCRNQPAFASFYLR